MVNAHPPFHVTMSGVDKLMPDVDLPRVFESRLVHQLGRDKVIYCTHSRQLYFWEPANGRLRRVIECALRSLGRAYADRPVVMDNKGVFNKPRKIRLAGDDLVVVTSALRLSGVDVVINHTALSDWNRSQP
jgi:hypothetical protein